MKFKIWKRPNFVFYPFLLALVFVIFIMFVLTWKFELHKLFATFLTVLVISKNGSNARAVNKDVCLEPGCVVAAADIINSIDSTIDPCDGN